MTRVKSDMKCPYCEKVCSTSGITAHVRARHTAEYEAFKTNRVALIEQYRIKEGEAPPAKAEPEVAPEPEVEATPEEPMAAPAETQKKGGFLAAISTALRDL